MRILVAGGAGFIPSHLCDLLLAEGHDVIAVDNFITGSPDNIAHIKDPRFAFEEKDITQGLEIAGPLDAILDMASPASPVDFSRIPLEIMLVGSTGTRNGLELAQAKKARFLMASTSEVYGDPLVHPQPESYWGNVNPIGPRSVYDEAKRFSEAMTAAYARSRGVDTRIIRIFNTYGPRMRPDDGRVVPNFVGQALRGENITVYGDGSQTRSFCYVSDLVAGIYAVLTKGDSNPYNLGNPVEMSIKEFAEKTLAACGGESSIVYDDLPMDDPKLRQPDITRAKTKLGWEPKVSLDEGLRLTIDYFKSRL